MKNVVGLRQNVFHLRISDEGTGYFAFLNCFFTIRKEHLLVIRKAYLLVIFHIIKKKSFLLVNVYRGNRQ